MMLRNILANKVGFCPAVFRASSNAMRGAWAQVGFRLFARRWLASEIRTTNVQHDHYGDLKSLKGPYGSYQHEYDLSIYDPDKLWSQAASQLEWFTKP
jgi:hypothetical protein